MHSRRAPLRPTLERLFYSTRLANKPEQRVVKETNLTRIESTCHEMLSRADETDTDYELPRKKMKAPMTASAR
jgi:hypothetical protein